TGRQSYGTGPATAVAYRVVHQEPDLSDVPSWLAPLLVECLRRDPAARPTAAQLVALLEAAAPAVPAAPAAPNTASSPDVPAQAPATPAEQPVPPGELGVAPTRAWWPGAGRRVDKRAAAGSADLRAKHRQKLH